MEIQKYHFLAVDCGHPGNIENGRVIVANGTSYNSGIEYHCIPQYERIGPYLRKCMENGIWSGEEPRCQSKYSCYIFIQCNQVIIKHRLPFRSNRAVTNAELSKIKFEPIMDLI